MGYGQGIPIPLPACLRGAVLEHHANDVPLLQRHPRPEERHFLAVTAEV
jgi:hypothetical protein